MALINETMFQIASDLFAPVSGWIDKAGTETNTPPPEATADVLLIINLKLQSDFCWDVAALLHRIAHPENYAPYEDFDATVKSMKVSIMEKLDHIDELHPAQQIALLEALEVEPLVKKGRNNA